ERTHCVCNHVPGLLGVTDEPEICGLIAPRPSLYLCVTGDWTADFPTDEYPDMRRMYALHGAEDAIDVEQWDCGHDFHADMRQRMYGWFARHLNGASDAVDVGEGHHELLTPDEVAQLDGPVPGARSWTEFPAYYREQHAGRRGPLTREALRGLLGSDARAVRLPTEYVTRRSGGSTVVAGATGVPIPMNEGTRAGESCQRLAVIVHPDGREAVAVEDVQTLRSAGWEVVIADVRFYGELRIRWSLNAAVWGRPVLGMAVDDIVTLLNARPNTGGAVACVGFGALGWAAVCAAVLDERITHVVAPDLDPTALDTAAAPSLPNILRYGSPDALLALCGSCLLNHAGVDDSSRAASWLAALT
ncbi:MAG: hypothetical protein ABGY41_13935, partial [Candidatus Poribacteria bacterium]